MTTTHEPASAAPSAPDPYRRAVGRLVAQRVKVLSSALDRPATRATLARLRANAAREPGTDPTIWSWTIDGVPGSPRSDDATAEEQATHTALTLYALHQQSKDVSVHRDGVGLGHAVGRLDRQQGGGDNDITAVRRRFNALVTSGSFTELAYHLRGLIGQLRSAEQPIPLDYGLLADDLTAFAHPTGADRVRRRWARQFHQLDTTATVDNPTADHPTPEETP